MKYLIYLRVSKEIQDEKTQLHFCLEFLKNRVGDNFEYEIFKDIKSSKKGVYKRDGSSKMLESMKFGDTIVAMRIDRLSRKSTETHLLVDDLIKQGVSLLLVEQPNLSENKTLLGLFAGMAEDEVTLLRSRVKEKLTVKKFNNHRYSRFLPYGYAMHETKTIPIRVGNEIVEKRGILIPVYEEQQALKLMVEMQALGYSLSKISKELERLGHKNRENRPFQKTSIARILARAEKARLAAQPHLCEL